MKVTQIKNEDGNLDAFTVADLRQALAKLPAGTLVVLASDAEGNQYHPLMEAGEAHFRSGRYDGELIDLDAGDVVKAGDRPCIVLWPMD